MEMKLCQSCAMPLYDESVKGTNKDNGKNDEYCIYCYENGEILGNTTMEEMIEICVPHLVREDGMSEEEARKMISELLPTLKRWKK